MWRITKKLLNRVQGRAQREAREEWTAKLLLGARMELVPKARLLEGQLIVCDAGDVVPATGVIIKGAGVIAASEGSSTLRHRNAAKHCRVAEGDRVVMGEIVVFIARKRTLFLVQPDDRAAMRARDPSRRWYIEILGFWTRDYLERKLATYGRALIPNLILCVDDGRKVDEAQLPEAARVVRYRRKIDARAVLDVIQECTILTERRCSPAGPDAHDG